MASKLASYAHRTSRQLHAVFIVNRVEIRNTKRTASQAEAVRSFARKRGTVNPPAVRRHAHWERSRRRRPERETASEPAPRVRARHTEYALPCNRAGYLPQLRRSHRRMTLSRATLSSSSHTRLPKEKNLFLSSLHRPPRLQETAVLEGVPSVSTKEAVSFTIDCGARRTKGASAVAASPLLGSCHAKQLKAPIRKEN